MRMMMWMFDKNNVEVMQGRKDQENVTDRRLRRHDN